MLSGKKKIRKLFNVEEVPIQNLSKKENIKCLKHKKYTGKREPRTDCLDCWKYFARRLGNELVTNKMMEDLSENNNNKSN